MNSKVDWFFDKATPWQEEYKILRTLVLECGLNEELKWGVPCYTYNKHNVVLIHGFKEYCALLFHKGALLQDPQGILVQQTANVQAARQIRFRNLDEILLLQQVISAYIHEAVQIEKSDLKVELKKTSEYVIPHEFQAVLDDVPELKEAFYSLTPGRQRGYLLYFSSAKQSKTREARIEKYYNKILERKGIDD
jgi:uncharacterized protein YdeI (YjbR/CyaY-like superfamily)